MQIGSSKPFQVGVLEHIRFRFQPATIAAMECQVANLDTRLGTQESFCQFVCPGVLCDEAKEVTTFCLLVLLGFFLHLAHQSIQDIVNTHYGQLSHCSGNGAHLDNRRQFGGGEADLLVSDARDADNVRWKARQRELALVVADGAARGRDVDAGIRHRFSRLGIADNSSQRVLSFLRKNHARQTKQYYEKKTSH